VVLEVAGQHVFGVIHRPAAGGGRRPGVVIFHGLVGSKDQPHQIFVKLAEALARAGMVALRIDFRGRGDSEGETVDITPAADLMDARAALDYLAVQPDVDPARLALCGMSWGGAIAACLAGHDPRVSAVALWSSAPVAGFDWNPPFRQVDGRDVAEMWGNIVGRQFYDGLQHIHPLADLQRARGPVLIAYGTTDEEVPQAAVDHAAATLAAAGIACDVLAIPDADHAFMGYDWEQALLVGTVDWLRRALGVSEA
jgi:dienelactone hydrolase